MTMEGIVRKIAERYSRADARVNDLDLIHLRPYMEGFLDPQWVEAQLHDYDAWASKNSDDTLRRSILHRPLGLNTCGHDMGGAILGTGISTRPVFPYFGGRQKAIDHCLQYGDP